MVIGTEYSFAARPERIDVGPGSSVKLMIAGTSVEEFNEMTLKEETRESRIWVPAEWFFGSSADDMRDAVFDVTVRRVC